MLNAIHIMFTQLVARLREDDRGEVSLEYALVGGLMAVAIVAGIAALSPQLLTWFTNIGGYITKEVPALPT